MRTALAVALVCIAAATAPVDAATVHGVPLPPRTRAIGTSGLHFASGLGFRKTVVYYRKHFARRGVLVDEIPAYGYRGVIVARFVAKRPSGWLAVHVFRVAGRTQIYVVPAPSKPPPGNS